MVGNRAETCSKNLNLIQCVPTLPPWLNPYHRPPDQTRTKKQLVVQRYYSSIASCAQKLPRHVVGHKEFLAVFHNLYKFMPRFLAEFLTMFCGTLVGNTSLQFEVALHPCPSVCPLLANFFYVFMDFDVIRYWGPHWKLPNECIVYFCIRENLKNRAQIALYKRLFMFNLVYSVIHLVKIC
jgi:hypothetical protein